MGLLMLVAVACGETDENIQATAETMAKAMVEATAEASTPLVDISGNFKSENLYQKLEYYPGICAPKPSPIKNNFINPIRNNGYRYLRDIDKSAEPWIAIEKAIFCFHDSHGECKDEQDLKNPCLGQSSFPQTIMVKIDLSRIPNGDLDRCDFNVSFTKPSSLPGVDTKLARRVYDSYPEKMQLLREYPDDLPSDLSYPSGWVAITHLPESIKVDTSLSGVISNLRPKSYRSIPVAPKVSKWLDYSITGQCF